MTFFHFGNCVALAYGPYFLAYKYSSLPEYGAFWKCFQVGGIYILTQLCKMLLLATFFPSLDGSANSVNLFHEIIRTTIDFGDLVGFSIALGRAIGVGNSVASGHIKILIAGIGWATADLVLTKALPLWVGARGLQFDWKYILMSLEANVNLVFYLSVACLVWLWMRSDLPSAMRSVVTILLSFSVFRQVIPTLLKIIVSSKTGGFSFFVLSSIPTFCLAFISLYLFIVYCSHASNQGTN